MYKAGLHILCEIHSDEVAKTSEVNKWHAFIQQNIQKYALVQVGESLHQFEGGGYTAVHCLTESHIAIHTWPEYNLVTFDVFLCNYLKDNHALVEQIAEEIVNFFSGKIIQQHNIKR